MHGRVGMKSASSLSDTSFSIAVVPDTQRETNNTSINFSQRMQWLADNKNSLDLRFMIQNGDLVDWDTPDHAHYERASAGLSILEAAKREYSLCVGNHDTAAVMEGGSAAPGDTHANLRITTTWNAYFPASRFRLDGVYEAGKSDNAFRTFRAGGLNWLVLNLEFMPRTGVINWSKTVLAAYPHHNVIISTHMFIDGNGNIGQGDDGYGDNSPQYMFDNLVKVYPNVRFVFNGHVGTTAYRRLTGTNGNEIHAILDCWHQGNTNPTRLMFFDVKNQSINTYVYEPLFDITKTTGVYTITNIDWVR